MVKSFDGDVITGSSAFIRVDGRQVHVGHHPDHHVEEFVQEALEKGFLFFWLAYFLPIGWDSRVWPSDIPFEPPSASTFSSLFD